MGQVKVWLIGGDSAVDRAIQFVERGDVTHAAIEIGGRTWEAKGMPDPADGDEYAGFWDHAPGKYDGNPDARFILIDVPDLAAAEAKARALRGTRYGYFDCVRGGVYDRTGQQLPDNELFVDCSEAVTRILRAGGLALLQGITAGCVTPERLENALKELV